MLKFRIKEIEFDNPIVIAPGPWSRGPKKFKAALLSGAGAVVTESIVSEPYPDTSPRYAYDDKSGGLQNIRLYSGMILEEWLQMLKDVNDAGRYGSTTKIIASIMGESTSELRYIAKKIEATGVDGLELGLACPMGEGAQIIVGDPKLVYEYTKAVVDAVNIPVAVKLNAAVGNMHAVVKAAERAGASVISGIDTLRCILDVDIESGMPCLPTYGGYSGAPIRPVALASVASIAQSTDLPIIGIGGIENYRNAIEFAMLGAWGCGIGTGILMNGYEIIPRIISELSYWLKEHNYKSFEDLRGVALAELRAFEELKENHKVAKLETPCRDSECKVCIKACLEEALTLGADGLITVDLDKCDGCGICQSICPQKLITLDWR